VSLLLAKCQQKAMRRHTMLLCSATLIWPLAAAMRKCNAERSFAVCSLAAAVLGLSMLSPAAATCKIAAQLPPGAEPSAATFGPDNSLVVASDSGTVLFLDLDDLSVREDTSLNDKYKDSYGWFDLEGIAMTSSESTFLYLGMENQAKILEYEWHSTHEIFRSFSLPSFERRGNRGMESLTWVPTDASRHQGYFYVGSQMTGHVFIYELPLLDKTGPKAAARLVDIWTPLKGNNDVAGLSYSSGHIFVNYDDGNSNHVLIFPVLQTGLPGALREQYEVDVQDAEGMAVRKTSSDEWEIFFTSDTRKALFAYHFRFVTGFELHHRCRVGNMRALPSSSAAALGSRHPGFFASSGVLACIMTLLASL